MNKFIENVNKELKELCSDYLAILKYLKSKEIINQKTYEECSDSKSLFLDK